MDNALKMRLDLFGETEQPAAGTPAAAESAAASAEGAQSTGAAAPETSAEPRRQLIFPAVPKQEVRRPQRAAKAAPTPVQPQQPQMAAPAAQPAKPAAEQPPEGETWEDLIRGRYKEQFGKAVEEAISKRLRNQNQVQSQLDAAMGALKSIAPLYGIDAENLDVQKLVSAIEDDDRLYEKKALEKGIPTATEKQIQMLERKQRALEEEKRLSLEQEALRNHFASLREQEAELKRDYPDFDLMREVQENPAFARMTALGGGLSVRQAYMALHGDELMQRQAKAAAEETKKNVSRAIQAGAMRPQENGMAQSGGGRTRIDPRTLTREQRADINRRAAAGEKVYFE